MPTAGTIGRIDRPLIDQFTNAVNTNVPATHKAKSSAPASRRRYKSMPASVRIQMPPAQKRASWMIRSQRGFPSTIKRKGPSAPREYNSQIIPKTTPSVGQSHRLGHKNGTKKTALALHPPVKA